MGRLAVTSLLALTLLGCQLPNATQELPVSELVGQVSFPTRQTQAAIEDVAGYATVSLINTVRNRTEATTVTDASGSFRLSFPTSFKPAATDSFYLEAIKGLNANLPGNNAARVRTIAQHNGGWTTITNTVPNTGIVLSTMTTALSVGAALKPGSVTPTDLIGKLIGTVYTPVTNLSDTDFTSLKTLTNQVLTDNQDPVAGIGYTAPSTWYRVLAGTSVVTVASLSVTVGDVGTSVLIKGTGFESTIASNSVQFNGVTATVTAATPGTLTTTVPLGATTGKVTVKVGASTAEGPVFTVTGLIQGSVATDSSGVIGGGITTLWRHHGSH